MATGFGIDPTRDTNGDITSGTSSQDIRLITGGMYSQGILTGCEIVTSSSLMRYTISPGVVANDIGGGEVTLMPIASTHLTVSPGPASGTRTDYIYVKQNLPSVEGNSDIVYGTTSTAIPATDRRLVIGAYRVNAGAQNTSAATKMAGISYATPHGASGRYLVNERDTFNGVMNSITLPDLSGSFYIPTTRFIEVNILLSLGYEGIGPKDSIYADLYIDGSRAVRFNSGIVEGSYSQVMSWTWHTTLTAGTHILSLKRFESHNTGKIKLLYGSNGYPGTVLIAKDAGGA